MVNTIANHVSILIQQYHIPDHIQDLAFQEHNLCCRLLLSTTPIHSFHCIVKPALYTIKVSVITVGILHR